MTTRPPLSTLIEYSGEREMTSGLPSLANQSITVLRAPTMTDHGAQVPDWTQQPQEIPVSGCSVQPIRGAEDELHRTGERADISVWAPVNTDVTAADHVQIDGYTRPFRVVGEPERWRGIGFLEHTVIRLSVWEG